MLRALLLRVGSGHQKELTPDLIVLRAPVLRFGSGRQKELTPDLIVLRAPVLRFGSGRQKELTPDVIVAGPRGAVKPWVRRFAVFVSVPRLGSSRTINPSVGHRYLAAEISYRYFVVVPHFRSSKRINSRFNCVAGPGTSFRFRSLTKN